MRRMPLRCVVDTNVATTANRMNPGAPATCVAASARALQDVMKRGHLFLDQGRKIVEEYWRHLHAKGEPGPGDAFFRWVLQEEWVGARVTRVPITAKSSDPDDFEELPSRPGGGSYDPSDRKFLAVSAAHAEHPPILQAFDSKWVGWQADLAKTGVRIHFLCPAEIKAKYAEKMAR